MQEDYGREWCEVHTSRLNKRVLEVKYVRLLPQVIMVLDNRRTGCIG